MNTRYQIPEVIGTLKEINQDGDDNYKGDRVVGIQVMLGKEYPVNGLVQFDIRDFKKNVNLILEIELPELVSAISMATLNADKN